MIGFRWDGPAGQESEIRFEVEAMFDPNRKQMADQIEAGQAGNDEEEATEWSTTTAPPPTSGSTTTTVAAAPADEPGDDDGGAPFVVFVAVGTAIVAGVIIPLVMRRKG
jgi:hypothetical protein